jgi:hypothetical protein
VLTHAIEQSHFEELIFAQLSRNSSPFMVEARSFITTPSHATSVRSILILSSHMLIRYSLQTQMQLWSENKGAQITFPSIVLLDCPLLSYVSFSSLNQCWPMNDS